MKCSDVERAVAVFSGSELLLFVQLKTTVPARAASSQFLASDPSRQLCHERDISSANNACADETAHVTARESVCNEIKTLLKQWLPVHSQPDDVEVVDKMPPTKHGKFLSHCDIVSMSM